MVSLRVNCDGGIKGEVTTNIMASAFRSSDCPVDPDNSTKCMILQASDCTHHFVSLVFESFTDTM